MNEFRDALRVASSNKRARAARHSLADSVTSALIASGIQAQAMGNLIGEGRVNGESPRGNGNDGRVAVGYLCRTAGSLLGGCLTLTERENTYAASALIRQLVEIEYLTHHFWIHRDDAAKWLNASPKERRKSWQPSDLRKRYPDKFRDRDYWLHCGFGGHPTPEGSRWLLSGSTESEAFTMTDALGHGLRVWEWAQPWLYEPVDLSGQVADWRSSDTVPELLSRGTANLLAGLDPLGRPLSDSTP